MVSAHGISPWAVSKALTRRRADGQAVRAARSRLHLMRRSGVVLERKQDAGAVGDDLAVLHLHVELRYFGDAQVTQGLGRRRNRVARGVLPRHRTAADHFGDTVNPIA